MEFCTRLVGWCKWWCPWILWDTTVADLQEDGYLTLKFDGVCPYCGDVLLWEDEIDNRCFLLLGTFHVPVSQKLRHCKDPSWVINQLVLVFHGMSLVRLFHAAQMCRAWRSQVVIANIFSILAQILGGKDSQVCPILLQRLAKTHQASKLSSKASKTIFEGVNSQTCSIVSIEGSLDVFFSLVYPRTYLS